MNTIEFSHSIPADQLAIIFKDYFEKHMAVYDLLRGLQGGVINSVNIDTASIIYSVRLLDEDNKEKIVKALQSRAGSLTIYGKKYTPEVYLNGDLLCITIKK